MKKAFFILIITAITSAAWSQSLSSVNGKTLDGKTLQVTYYHGASEDYIQTVKYQLVDELQSKITKLQNETKELQSRLDAANRRMKEMENDANASKSEQSSQLQNQIAKNNEQVQQLNHEIERLHFQLDSLSLKSANDVQDLQSIIEEKSQRIAEYQEQIQQQEQKQKQQQQSPTQKPVTSPVIGIEANLGQVNPGKGINGQWQKVDALSMKYSVYFRTANLTKTFPLSIEAGVGYQSFGLKAKTNAHSLTNAANDYDGFAYNAIFNYSDLQENLKFNNLIIPIRLYIGRTIKNQTTAYAKIGLTPSIVLNSNYQSSGSYSIKGYYPQWGVLLENMEELGFVDDQQYCELGQPSVNKFVLWGNLSLGVNIPLGRAPIQINAAIDMDYSITSLGKAEECDVMPNGKGLLSQGGNVLIPGVNVGLIYLLK